MRACSGLRWWSWVASVGLIWAMGHTAVGADTPGRYFPPDTVAYLEVTDLAPVIEGLKASKYLEELKTSPQFKQAQENPDLQKADAGRKILEAQLGIDLWTAAQKLLGRQVVIGVIPGEPRKQPENQAKPDTKQPESTERPDGKPEEKPAPPAAPPRDNIVIVYAELADPDCATILKQRLDPILTLSGQPFERTTNDNGVEVLRVADKLFVGQKDLWIVVSNNRDRFESTLAAIAGGKQPNLAGVDSFQKMRQQMGDGHLGQLYVNSGLIAQATGGRLGIPQKLDNPLASFLGGGILEMLVHSPYAGATLDVSERGFALTAGVAGDHNALGEAYQPFFADFPKSGTRPLPQPSGMIGGFTLYRDLASWYTQREQLLAERLLPAFDQFETGISNLLPGKDLSSDVIPLLGSNFTFVAAEQKYDHLDGEPGVKLPGFAMILDLNDPEKGAEIIQLLFQTTALVSNFAAGQQGRQPWILESDVHSGVKIQYGKYLEKPSGERLPLVFNFMPAAARVENRYILATSIDLCRDLIDQLQEPANGQIVDKNLNVEFNFAPFADIVAANQDYFQAQRIQQGISQEQASAEVAAALRLLRYFQMLDFNTTVSKETFQAHLKGSWQ